VRTFLDAAQRELADALADLRDKVQLTLKATYVEEALMRGVIAGSPAIARLRERVRGLPEEAAYYERIRLGELVAAEVERVRAHDAATMLGRLEPLALATRQDDVTRPDDALNAAFLVKRSGVERFSGAVSQLASEHEGRMRLRFVGPLPPYSFTPQLDVREGATWA